MTLTVQVDAHGDLVVDVLGWADARVSCGAAVVSLAEGGLSVDGWDHEVVVRVAGTPVARMAASGDRLFLHRYLPAPQRPAPQTRPRLHHAYAMVVGAPGTLSVTSDGPVDSVAAVLANGRVVEGSRSDEDNTWCIRLPSPAQDSPVRYRVRGESAGEEFWAEDAGPVYESPFVGAGRVQPPSRWFSLPMKHGAAPEWFDGAVIYHLVVDRFAATDSTFSPVAVGWLGNGGGTLAGLTDRLPYIRGLGVDAVLLSPVHQGRMNMNYDVVDHFTVDPRLGGAGDMRHLCAEAHRVGLRVLLDTELSYLGAQHPAVHRAFDDGDSPERGWLVWDEWRNAPFGWQGSPAFAAVDHEQRAIRQLLICAVQRWLDFGVDGFRFDSAHGASLDFWTELGAVVRHSHPDAVMIAEDTVDNERYRGRITGYLDFSFCAALRAFARDGSVDALAGLLSHDDTSTTSLSAVAFVENHDMDRLWVAVGGDRRRLLLGIGLLLCCPGTLALYYGTEVGVGEGAPTSDTDGGWRPPMRWGPDQDPAILAQVRLLTGLRRAHPVLRYGDCILEHARAGLLVFRRGNLLVIANGSERSREFSLPQRADGFLLLHGEALCALNGRRLLMTVPALSLSVVEET